MKTFLLPVDPAASSNQPITYGYKLARQLKANVILFNAALSPAYMTQLYGQEWLEEDELPLPENCLEHLLHVKHELEGSDDKLSFKPMITCLDMKSNLFTAVKNIVVNKRVDLIVLGTKEATMFLADFHSRKMTGSTSRPILLVPPEVSGRIVKRIAFATDFKDREVDLAAVHSLIQLARPLMAEILLIHIGKEGEQGHEFQHWINKFMIEVSDKADYPYIRFSTVRNNLTETRLEWLAEHGQIDLLAMVQRSNDFMEKILRGSITQQLAGHIPVPMIVFPETISTNISHHLFY